MAEALKDLIGLSQTVDLDYLEYLSGLSLQSALSSEPQTLAQSSQSILRSIQALSKRSRKSMVESAIVHASLPETIRIFDLKARELTAAVPQLDAEAERFSASLSKSSGSRILTQRKETLHLIGASDRIVDLLELPALLLSAVNANPLGYSMSLDLYGHIRRLSFLYPDSELVRSVKLQADDSIRQLAIDLISSLTASNLKLAVALRTTGWLKRVLPELVPSVSAEGSLPAIFLICRFSNLITTLEALNPLRELADEERKRQVSAGQSWSGGQHTERFLKRFIEIFREHSFSIISISKNVGGGTSSQPGSSSDSFDSFTPILSAFPVRLVGMLLETLRIYLPIVQDQTSRESILTQVLYCAGSLGRLGADFGMLIPSIGVAEWLDLVKRHRLLAGRLESAIADYKAPATFMGRHFVSGLGSGISTAIILQPLDLLKTRVQQSSQASLYSSWLELRQSPNQLRSLWRGTLPSALRTGFGSALYFSTLNAIRQYVAQSGSGQGSMASSTALPKLSNTTNLLSGAVARTWAGFVLMPLTVIKVRFESNLYSYPSLFNAAMDIQRREGFRGFFSGLGATAIRDAPYAGLYVLFYEKLKSHLGSLAETDLDSDTKTVMGTPLASSINFSSAILAGAVCSAVSNPFDAVKTRIQLQPQRYRNMLQAWYKMITEDGFRSLWCGLGLRMGRKALSSALAWTLYEELIRRSHSNI